MALLSQNNEHDYCKSVSFSKFVNLKNQGGLISASDSVFKIIQEADKMFLFLTDNFKSLHNIPNLGIKIIFHTVNMYSLDNKIFSDLNCNNVSLLERSKTSSYNTYNKKIYKTQIKIIWKNVFNRYSEPCQ